MAENDPRSIRDAIRWGLLLAGVATVGFRLPHVLHNYNGWREALQFGDSSGADGWKTAFLVDSVGSLVVLAISVGLFYLLRKRRQGNA